MDGRQSGKLPIRRIPHHFRCKALVGLEIWAPIRLHNQQCRTKRSPDRLFERLSKGLVSLNRYARRVDSTQKDILAGLRAAGIMCWVISEPCDVLTYYPPLRRWRPLECKPLKKRLRKDQASQSEFLALTHTPIVRTAVEAIEAVLAA